MTTTNYDTARPVSFQSNIIKIAGNLYYPDNSILNKKPTPAIVLSHPAGGVKEKTAGL